MIRVVIADDHPVLQFGLRSVIDAAGDMVTVGTATDGVAAVEVVARTRPRVVLMDLSMPRMSGLEATRQIVRGYPPVVVVILTAHASAEHEARAHMAGAEAFLPKDTPANSLLRTIRNVACRTDPRTPPRGIGFGAASSDPSLLNPRQRRVLDLLASGLPARSIASELRSSPVLVQDDLDMSLALIGAPDVESAVSWARHHLRG